MNRKKHLKLLLFAWLLLPLMLFSYQNCNQITSTRPNRALSPEEVQIALQNPATQESILGLDPKERDGMCSESANYLCVVNSFSPSHSYKHFFDHYCVGEQCYPLEVWTYDSSSALDQCPDCSPEDGQPGGRYNYDEIYCFNRKLAQITSVEDLQSGETLETAISKSQEACHNFLSN